MTKKNTNGRMTTSENVVGVDMGGTKINFGVVNKGKVLRKLKIDTPAKEKKEVIVQAIIDGIERVTEGLDFDGIGMGVPGLLDEDKGIVYQVTNIPSWDEVHLKDNIKEYFNKETYLTNDANCFVLGEKLYGKGKPFKNLIGVTLGTGVGAGLIINNQLHSGLYACAGELSSIPYKSHDFEHYCSGKFFEKEHNTTGKELFSKASQGDACALDIYKEFGKNLGDLVKVILRFISPDAILLGGSIIEARSYFYESFMHSVDAFPYKMVKDKLVIEYSDIDDIPILGSSALFELKKASQKESSSVLSSS